MYRAYDTPLGRTVALKILAERIASDPLAADVMLANDAAVRVWQPILRWILAER